MPVGLMVGATLNSAGLVSPVNTKLTDWLDSLAGPAWMLVAHWTFWVGGDALSRTVCGPPCVKVGAWLTGVMLMTRLAALQISWPPFAVPPLSCKVTVMLALP